jgi:uncharacterized protein
LSHISDLWKNKNKDLIEQSEKITNSLKKSTSKLGVNESFDFENLEEYLTNGKDAIMEEFDPTEGGFGGAPKFPRPVTFDFLFRMKDDQVLKACLFTLDKMAQGGMYDHIGGGFHRYSTDHLWHVPHFEKMMYDQAQLIYSYTDAFQITNEEIYKTKAEEILKYCLNEMRFENKAFFSAEDADSLPSFNSTEKLEGAFYVFTQKEIDEVLKEDAQKFSKIFGVKQHGNVNPSSDPHGELKNQNVLFLKQQDSKEFKEWKEKLFKFRSSRPRPHLDDKILTCWNGLMISSLSRASQVFRSKSYLQDAIKVARFIKTELYKGIYRFSNSFQMGYCIESTEKVFLQSKVSYLITLF